jgi:hypothetical protein
MAKVFKYWVIIAGNTPTAFRSREQEPLIPTLKQLQRTQPNATLAWFERDRLWTSPEQAEENLARHRGLRRERGATWRPGGQHKDPKARVVLTRDQKRAKFKKQLIRNSRDERPVGSDGDAPKSVERPTKEHTTSVRTDVHQKATRRQSSSAPHRLVKNRSYNKTNGDK